jgi:hypothetical protein
VFDKSQRYELEYLLLVIPNLLESALVNQSVFVIKPD